VEEERSVLQSELQQNRCSNRDENVAFADRWHRARTAKPRNSGTGRIVRRPVARSCPLAINSAFGITCPPAEAAYLKKGDTQRLLFGRQRRTFALVDSSHDHATCSSVRLRVEQLIDNTSVNTAGCVSCMPRSEMTRSLRPSLRPIRFVPNDESRYIPTGLAAKPSACALSIMSRSTRDGYSLNLSLANRRCTARSLI